MHNLVPLKTKKYEALSSGLLSAARSPVSCGPHLGECIYRKRADDGTTRRCTHYTLRTIDVHTAADRYLVLFIAIFADNVKRIGQNLCTDARVDRTNEPYVRTVFIQHIRGGCRRYRSWRCYKVYNYTAAMMARQP